VVLPLALAFPQEGSLLIETDDDGGKWVADVMNGIVFRLLEPQAPPGKAASHDHRRRSVSGKTSPV
jgi:hypothetical protein